MDLRVSKNLSVLGNTDSLISNNMHKSNFTVFLNEGDQDHSDFKKGTISLSNQKQYFLINNNHNSSDALTINKDCESKVDEDLTSLSWLHDNNLLQNLCQSTSKEKMEENISESNNLITTSDLSEDSLDDSSEKKLELQKTSKTITLKVPYNPLVHVNTKPPYSFSCLIFMAIEESPKKALPVKDIYSWIIVHFPYFRHAPTGWKNSVRHNLSLNKCFCKVDKDQRQNMGKGSLWCVDDEFRPNLLQALKRAPLYPLSDQDDKGDELHSRKSTLLDDISESCPPPGNTITEQRRKRYLKLDTNIGIYQHNVKARKINESTSEMLSNKSSADHTYSASTHEENEELLNSKKDSQLPRLHIIYNNIINNNDEVILPMNFEKDLESDDSLGSISYDLNNASKRNKCVQSVIVDGRKLKVFVKEEEERSLEEGAQALLSLANISRLK